MNVENKDAVERTQPITTGHAILRWGLCSLAPLFPASLGCDCSISSRFIRFPLVATMRTPCATNHRPTARRSLSARRDALLRLLFRQPVSEIDWNEHMLDRGFRIVR